MFRLLARSIDHREMTYATPMQVADSEIQASPNYPCENHAVFQGLWLSQTSGKPETPRHAPFNDPLCPLSTVVVSVPTDFRDLTCDVTRCGALVDGALTSCSGRAAASLFEEDVQSTTASVPGGMISRVPDQLDVREAWAWPSTWTGNLKLLKCGDKWISGSMPNRRILCVDTVAQRPLPTARANSSREGDAKLRDSLSRPGFRIGPRIGMVAPHYFPPSLRSRWDCAMEKICRWSFFGTERLRDSSGVPEGRAFNDLLGFSARLKGSLVP